MMIKLLLTLICSACLFLPSCGGSGSSSDTNAAANAGSQIPRAADTTVRPDTASAITEMPGKSLIAQSDCLGCHKEHDKLVGPPYADVARKYEATDETIGRLAGKIIQGGSGVWGTVPMSPHGDLTEADARKMVAYILSIK
jgi:cytochrome c